MRRSIEWKTKRADNTSYEVRATFFGGSFKLQFRESTEERWDYKRASTREDLEMLCDAVKRRYQRRNASQHEVNEAERLLKSCPP